MVRRARAALARNPPNSARFGDRRAPSNRGRRASALARRGKNRVVSRGAAMRRPPGRCGPRFQCSNGSPDTRAPRALRSPLRGRRIERLHTKRLQREEACHVAGRVVRPPPQERSLRRGDCSNQAERCHNLIVSALETNRRRLEIPAKWIVGQLKLSAPLVVAALHQCHGLAAPCTPVGLLRVARHGITSGYFAETIMRHYRTALDTLRAVGWTVRERSIDAPPALEAVWPPALMRRYPTIPAALTDFVSRIEACVNPDETEWFLTSADYAGSGETVYAWSEWERMELESYEEDGDAAGIAEVREFWNEYLPFFMDVSGDYAYFAVRVVEPKPAAKRWLFGGSRSADPPFGAVVHGAEDFRAVSQVAGSFDEFLAELAATVRNPQARGPLAGLV